MKGPPRPFAIPGSAPGHYDYFVIGSTDCVTQLPLSVAGPAVWNSLPDSLRDPAVESDRFRRDLKTHIFPSNIRDMSALEVSRNRHIQIDTYT